MRNRLNRIKDRVKPPTEAGPRHYVLCRKGGNKVIVDNFNREEYANSVDYIRLNEPVPPDAVNPADKPAKKKSTRKPPTQAQKDARAKKARDKRAAKKKEKEAAKK